MTRKKPDPIKKITLKGGRTVYRFTVDTGKKPRVDKTTGLPVLDALGHQKMMREQKTHTFGTRKEADDALAQIKADKSRGVLVRTHKKTLAEQVEEYLAGARDIRTSTLGNYRNAVKPAVEQLGHLPLQDLTKAHIDALVNAMLAGGRRVGTKGRPLAPSTVTLMLTVLSMVLKDAVDQGLVVRNVARLVKRPPNNSKPEMATWTAEQAAAFLAHVTDDRLYLAWCMSLYGLRRGEVLGLRWCDLDLEAATITVRVTRVIIDGEVVHSEPKSERGKRTLPLDPPMVAAARRLKAQHAAERLAAGAAYRAACADCGEGHLFVDELGELVHPESYSDRFEVLNRKAGLPRIRLHDTRHTCGTLMHLRGVPTAVISAWLGHASANFTLKTYVHSQDEALKAAGAAISTAYKAV